ncbi:MAG: SsrA-binding protein SmpB [Bacteroidetes bacterium]|jgi:SsrA-binding protein|nr:SsrA-binding protein SmpB [Bacteroidota bacterium]
MAKKDFSPEVANKKASFDYFFEQKFEAGLVLTGTEVKSLRTGQVNLTDAYCVFKDGELWVKNIHISEYKQGGYANHVAKSDRKLLLHKKELQKLMSKVKSKGVTIIPTRIYFNEKGFAKLEIALARGKKMFDKRESQKEQEAKREMARVMKRH